MAFSSPTSFGAVQSNVAQLTTLANTATALSGLLLATPQGPYYQPQNAQSSTGFIDSLLNPPPQILFHYEGENTVTCESDITDHYVQDNTAIQDQIARRPEMITTQGFIGELNDVVPPQLQALQLAKNSLTGLSVISPQLSVTAINAYNTAFQAYQTAANAVNAAKSAYSSISKLAGGSYTAPQNKQQTYFNQFYGYWLSTTLFTVQTPWAQFQNCAILKLRAIQNAETNSVTDFEVTFKVIRTANSTLSQAAQIYQAQQTAQLGASSVNNGTQNVASSSSATVQSGVTANGG